MADIKISELSAALTVGDSDVLPMTASGTTVKVSTSLLKEHAIGDNDISALGDGSVTGAILNVKSTSETADSNIAETMAKNGAHNLLPYPYYAGGTQIISGTTFTVASDGAITVSGTPSTYASFVLAHNALSGAKLASMFAGKSMTISAGSTDVTGLGINIECLDASNNTILAEHYIIAPRTISVPSNTVGIYMDLGCTTTFAGTATVIKPMITLATDPSTEYTPYAMTNGELTEKVATKTLINDTTIKFYATGNVRMLHLLGTGIGTSDNWASMLGSENLPKNTVYAPCFVAGQNTPCCIYLASNGDIKLMDYQGAPFGSAGTADVTLTWCV